MKFQIVDNDTNKDIIHAKESCMFGRNKGVAMSCFNSAKSEKAGVKLVLV